MKSRLSIPSRVTLTLSIVAAAVCFGPSPAARADQRLTNHTAVSQLPRMAVDGTTVHVVFQDSRSGKEEIYYMRSTNNGDTWSNAVQISSGDNANSVTPSIAAIQGEVHVVWSDYSQPVDARIVYMHSTNGGDDWLNLTFTRTFIPYPFYSCYGPSVASNGSNVHVVYHNHRLGNYEIYYVRSTNSGANWGTAVNISSSSGDSQVAKIASYNYSYVYVVWQETVNGAVEVYHNDSTDSGATWMSAPEGLSGGPGTNSLGPEIACRCSRAAVVWYDYRNSDVQVYFRHTSTNGGNRWAPEMAIGGEPFYGSAYFPSVTLWYSAGRAYVVWQHSVGTGNYEIYGNKTTNYGGQWTPGKAGTRLTSNSGDSVRPIIATSTDGFDVHLVWQDNRDGNWEIYYKRIDNRSGFTQGGVAIDLEGGWPRPQMAADSLAVPERSPRFAEDMTAQPNPFSTTTTIRYTVSQPAPVSLRIYDISGRLVRTLLGARQEAGERAAIWDGRDSSGRLSENGVYLCTIGAGDHRACRKIMLHRN